MEHRQASENANGVREQARAATRDDNGRYKTSATENERFGKTFRNTRVGGNEVFVQDRDPHSPRHQLRGAPCRRVLFELRIDVVDSGKIARDGKTYRDRWRGIVDWLRTDTSVRLLARMTCCNTDSEDD